MTEQLVNKLENWQRLMETYLPTRNPPTPIGKPPFFHRMGVHLIGNRETDFHYIGQLKPNVVKIVDPDPNVVRRVLAAIGPNGLVGLRDHPLSEQKEDMYRDPVGTGRRHALDWVEKLTTGRYKEFGNNPRISVMGINEPNVHNQAEEEIVFNYTKEFLTVLAANGQRGWALNLSVGWPRNDGENKPVVWDTFLPLEKIILDGGHYLCLHEYWYPQVTSSWGWLPNRVAQCPMSVPIIIGECAYTRQLANLPQPWGWNGNISAAEYAESLWYYHDNVDPNVLAVLPFTTGFAGQEWANKDTQPAHGEILKRVRQYHWPAVWPVKKGVPPVEPPVDPPIGDDMETIILPAFAGKITGFFGQDYGYPHEGQDVSMVSGTPIYAAYDGVIAWSDYEATSYGNYVRLFCPALKANFFYGHLQERKVQTGNSVKRGQLIGLSGNTGRSTGPHLHLEIRQTDANGAYVVHKAGQPLYRQNGRVDPLGWLAGWISMGGKVEYR